MVLMNLKQRVFGAAEKIVKMVEIVLALGLILSVVVGMMLGGRRLWATATVWSGQSFQTLIDQSLLYIIGLEVAMMLIKRNPNIVLDILIFAIARKMIVEISGGMDFFLGTLAIFVLYLIRHYDFNRLGKRGMEVTQHDRDRDSPIKNDVVQDAPPENPSLGVF